MIGSQKAFIHLELNQEVQAIGGHYVLTKEVRMPFNGQEVLYYVGYGLVNTSCCGMGGTCYALVPGFIRHWKNSTTPDGNPVSNVLPIQDQLLQQEIQRLITQKEQVPQVNFQ